MRAIILQADMDAHDGKELLALSVQTSDRASHVTTRGIGGCRSIRRVCPNRLFEKETPTLLAIAKSYKVNNQVVQGEVQQQNQDE